jgi:hypothetical protein
VRKLVSWITAVSLIAVLPICTLAGGSGYKVKYDGGSIADVKTGATLRLVMSGNQIQLLDKDSQVVSIPASSAS